jgi:hypothetical protein
MPKQKVLPNCPPPPPILSYLELKVYLEKEIRKGNRKRRKKNISSKGTSFSKEKYI